MVVSCYEGIYRTGPVPHDLAYGYAVYTDGAPFHWPLPRLLGAASLTWGARGGIGTRGLAFALLADEFGEEIAWHSGAAFRDAVIARLPRPPRAPRPRST